VGAVALGLAGLIAVWIRRWGNLERYPLALADSVFSMNWLYSGFWFIYRRLRLLTGFITEVLEGEGGILWALLLLVLLLALLAGNGAI
jgi:hypothetical protein